MTSASAAILVWAGSLKSVAATRSRAAATVEPVQHALFGRSLIEPEVIRMLLFGLALVLIMLFRPAGLLPSAVRKRELAGEDA